MNPGSRIMQRREELGISREELAKMMNTTVDEIINIELGIYDEDYEKLKEESIKNNISCDEMLCMICNTKNSHS